MIFTLAGSGGSYMRRSVALPWKRCKLRKKCNEQSVAYGNHVHYMRSTNACCNNNRIWHYGYLCNDMCNVRNYLFSMEIGLVHSKIVLAGEDLATFVTDHIGAPFMSYIHVIGQSFS